MGRFQLGTIGGLTLIHLARGHLGEGLDAHDALDSAEVNPPGTGAADVAANQVQLLFFQKRTGKSDIAGTDV